MVYPLLVVTGSSHQPRFCTLLKQALFPGRRAGNSRAGIAQGTRFRARTEPRLLRSPKRFLAELRMLANDEILNDVGRQTLRELDRIKISRVRIPERPELFQRREGPPSIGFQVPTLLIEGNRIIDDPRHLGQAEPFVSYPLQNARRAMNADLFLLRPLPRRTTRMKA